MSDCIECGKSANRVSAWGPFCSAECFNNFNDARKLQHERLGIEPLTQIPDELDVAAFEEFTLKIAVHALDNLGEVQSFPPWLQEPELLARRVKDLLFQHLPRGYVRSWEEGSGHAKTQMYAFDKSLPKDLVFEAMRKAGLSWSVRWEEG